MSLPEGLPESYERALRRIIGTNKVDIAAQIFRLVAAAKRPLSIGELREAIAVEPLTTRMNEGRLVNDVRQLVSWCASLIVQDEEECLIQFAHHSVKEFLLSDSEKAPPLCFEIKLHEAKHELTEICLTYLSFDIFKRQLVMDPQAQVPTAPITPMSILRTSILKSKTSSIYRSWLKLEKFVGDQSGYNIEVCRQLDSLQQRIGKGWVLNFQAHHQFLAYASEHWLSHTVRLRPDDSLWGLWRSLVLDEDTFAARIWTRKEFLAGEEAVKEYILRHGHWALAILFQECGGAMTSKQWDSLKLCVAQDLFDETCTSVFVRHDFLKLSTLHEALQAVDWHQSPDLVFLHLRSSLDTFLQKISSTQHRKPFPHHQPANSVLTRISNAIGSPKLKLSGRDIAPSRTQYQDALVMDIVLYWGQLTAAHGMIKADPEVYSHDRDQIVALLEAVRTGDREEILKLLDWQDAIYHVKLASALFLAAKCGHTEIREFLCKLVKVVD